MHVNMPVETQKYRCSCNLHLADQSFIKTLKRVQNCSLLKAPFFRSLFPPHAAPTDKNGAYCAFVDDHSGINAGRTLIIVKMNKLLFGNGENKERETTEKDRKRLGEAITCSEITCKATGST